MNILLKKEFLFKEVKKDYNIDLMLEETIEEYRLVKTFAGLLTLIIKKENLIDYVDTREKYIEKYNYIVEYFKNYHSGIDSVVIEQDNFYYNEIIELIKED